MNLQKLKEKWKQFLKEQAKFRTMPPVAIGMVLSIIQWASIPDNEKWMGINSIDEFYSPLIIGALIISALVYMRIAYEKEWKGYWHWPKKIKLFHYFGFAFTGIGAAMLPYFSSIGMLFFGLVNIESGGEITYYLPVIGAYYFFYSIIAKDVFSSFGGGGIYFKMPVINKSPMKNYSPLEYKIRKHLPKRVSRVIFTE